MNFENKKQIFCVPKPGQLFKIVNDWSVKIYRDTHNKKLLKLLNLCVKKEGKEEFFGNVKNGCHIATIVFPSNCIFKLNKIDIRKQDFYVNKIFLTIKFHPDQKINKLSINFWVKFEDINGIEFVEEQYVDKFELKTLEEEHNTEHSFLDL